MKQQRILVVDDERNLCDILLYNLSMAGYEAVAAFSAEEALEKEPADFDLILLDVMLPGLSGYELAQKLKTDIATKSIPIVFLTAMGAEDNKLHGFDLGAYDYIPKPFSVREVLARIKAVLGRTSQAQSVIQELCYEGLKLNIVNKSVTADGKETVVICAYEHDDNWKFTFSDNGVGIDAEHLPRIFERFYRIDKGRSRSLGGTGLGLSIVKNAVMLHGGTIIAKAEEDGGMRFEFTLKK